MKLNSKQKIITVILILAGIVSVAGVFIQISTNVKAKQIVAENTDIENEAKQKANDYFEVMRPLFTKSITSSENYQIEYQTTLKNEADTIASLELLQKRTLQGVNAPSENHKQKVQNVIEHYIDSAQNLPSLFDSRVCLYEENKEVVETYTAFQQSAKDLATATTYEDSATRIEEMKLLLQQIQTSLDESVLCIQTSTSEDFQEQIQEIVDLSKNSIQQYQNDYLNPLQQAYIDQNDEALDQLSQTQSSLSVVYLSLFEIDEEKGTRPIDDLLLGELPL